MNAAAGGTNMPIMGGYNGGAKVQTMSEKLGHTRGVVTDSKERQEQEAYMLKFVNEERAFQGKPPLTHLTYAPGVELTKPIGPGPRTKETSNTVTDFDKGIKTTTKSRTVDGKTTISGGMGLITQEDRDRFFAKNPHAKALLDLKNQIELDNLGADISASAKKSAGYNKGGLVQEMKKLQMEHRRIKPGPNGKFSKEDRERKGQLILRITKLRKQIENDKSNDSTPTTPKTPAIPTNKEKKGGGFGLKRMIGGAADIMTGNLFDFDNRSGGGLLRKTANAVGRVVGGTADALTGNKWDFDNLGRPSAKVGNIKPPSVKISPPGSTTKKGGNITTLNMGKTSPPVGIDNTNAPPEIPYFSATIMRSSDKIKTLGIMV